LQELTYKLEVLGWINFRVSIRTFDVGKTLAAHNYYKVVGTMTKKLSAKRLEQMLRENDPGAYIYEDNGTKSVRIDGQFNLESIVKKINKELE